MGVNCVRDGLLLCLDQVELLNQVVLRLLHESVGHLNKVVVFGSVGLVRVSASAPKGLLISNSLPRYFFCGGDPGCIVGHCFCFSSSSASISMGELMGETGYIIYPLEIVA